MFFFFPIVFVTYCVHGYLYESNINESLECGVELNDLFSSRVFSAFWKSSHVLEV